MSYNVERKLVRRGVVLFSAISASVSRHQRDTDGRRADVWIEVSAATSATLTDVE